MLGAAGHLLCDKQEWGSPEMEGGVRTILQTQLLACVRIKINLVTRMSVRARN